MSEPAAPSTDLLTQMMLQNAPKDPLDMRRMLDGFAPLMNGDLPEVGAFHAAVPVRESSFTSWLKTIVYARPVWPL